MIKKIYYYIKKRVMWAICYLLPINNKKIVFSSYFGRGYGDNLKYIADKIIEMDIYNQYEIIWLINNEKESENIPKAIKTSKIDSFSGVYHLSTAKVWIDNCRKEYFHKKKNQFYMQTWHGGGAQKKCEADVIESLSRGYKDMAVKDAENTDLMISESSFMTDLYHKSFWYNGPVYECGYPRYDILLNTNDDLKDKVYKFYNINTNRKLVLYAPTFRVDGSFDAYDVDMDRLRKNLKVRFKSDFVVLVHLHPNVANEDGLNYDGINVINSTFYPDTQELIAVADVLIGDYSSINYDFCLNKRPVFRYAADFETYQNDRDLYFSHDEYPYPMAKNNDELEKIILGFDEDKYISDLSRFFEKLGTIFNPNSSQNIANLIIDLMKYKGKIIEFVNENKSKFKC